LENLTNSGLIVTDIHDSARADIYGHTQATVPLSQKSWALYSYLVRPNSKTLARLAEIKSAIGFPMDGQSVITAHVRQPQVPTESG
jgi:hypothetical protein